MSDPVKVPVTIDLDEIAGVLKEHGYVLKPLPSPPPPAPTIDSFAADFPAPYAGQDVTLSWAVTGDGAVVTLSSEYGGPTFGPGKGSQVYTLNQVGTVAFTLTARNAGGEATATVSVVVLPVPVVPPPPPDPGPVVPPYPKGVDPRPPWLVPLEATYDPAADTLTYHAPSTVQDWVKYLTGTFALGRSHWAGQDAGPLNDLDAAVSALAPPDTGGPRDPADPNDPGRVDLDAVTNPPVFPPITPSTANPIQPGVEAEPGSDLWDLRTEQLRAMGFTEQSLRDQGLIP